MKKSFLKITLALLAGMFIFVACSDDDDDPKPVARFSFEVDGTSVVFTNESTDADTYSWDFGDGNTSTAESPTHEYADGGSYSVKLTATGPGGAHDVTRSVNIEAPPMIEIDGNFDDWAAVPSNELFTASIVEAETTLTRLKEIKVTSDEMFIYLYFKLDTLYGNAMDLYLNTDLSAETGYMGWMWREQGANYLMQGFKNNNYDMRLAAYDEEAGGGWGWLTPNVVDEGSGLFVISELKQVSGTIMEFEGRVIREFIPGLGSQVRITVGHSGVEGGPWTTSGGLPMVPAEGDKNLGLLVTLK